MASEITDNIQSIFISSNALNLEDLCIIPGKFCWSIQVDFLILQMDGNPTDACSIASYVAFQCCKIPKVTLLAGPSGSMDDFEIIGDISEGIPFNISRIPILMTAIMVGNVPLVDGSNDEWDCSSCAVTNAIDRSGMCCGMLLTRNGLLSSENMMEAIKTSIIAAATIFVQLDEFFLQMEAIDKAAALDSIEAPPIRVGLLMA
eukprot:CAMPEP_0170085808 /NCGR_PEP_ID=MMETSP0019_2-20121128/20600_1 /TAXON_ID=98059 /ORGANISM="Dinobryon sp., Strain UTEXLB2267" /LENGTH=202 /DNA_ID=CAMNT_0010302457 /DNA_START=260 /DNA_END=868 /DNA_ORIENTATION=+